MRIFRRMMLLLTTMAAVLTMSAVTAYAQWRGGYSMTGNNTLTFGISPLNAEQKDINGVIRDHRDSVGAGYKVSEMGSGYEFMGEYSYRFERTMFGMAFRPSYVMQSTDGACGTSNCKYDISGFTFFPIFRLTPLENGFIKFYMQIGLGYGKLDGTIQQGASSVKFSGDSFGSLAGIGANFCFTEVHCLTVEGNLRYLSFDRNMASSANGSFTGLTQAYDGGEVERAGRDLATSLSGIQGILAYSMNF